MMLSGFVFTLQLVLLAIVLCLGVMAWKTSRRQRSQHRSYMTLAILLGGLSGLGALATVVQAITVEGSEVWLELCLPAATMLLSAATVWRSTRIKQRQRPADTPSGGLRAR